MKQEISSGRLGEAHTVTVLRERGGSTSLTTYGLSPDRASGFFLTMSTYLVA
ncbi:MAG: hypothetical protein KME57_22540 [Scytonema hyalinum WJT4-NPBG1]|nr:hypothetical protein [Scytonema hyalinum WJT4-NPBG1]